MYQPHTILEYPEHINEGLADKANHEIYFESHAHFLKSDIYWGIGVILFGIWFMTLAEDNSQRILISILIMGGGILDCLWSIC